MPLTLFFLVVVVDEGTTARRSSTWSICGAGVEEVGEEEAW
jgi:hypothetical protein